MTFLLVVRSVPSFFVQFRLITTRLCFYRCLSVHRAGVRGRGACVADTTRYDDAVNERAVRILLECILVSISFYHVM